MKTTVSLNPLAPYRGVGKRLILLYKHVLGLIIGAHLVKVSALPEYKRKWLRSPIARFTAFSLRWLVKKDIRDLPFEVQLRRRLEMLGPTYIKLGQIMAIREDILPENITSELKHLLDRLPEIPFELIQEIIETSLQAPLDTLFQEIDPHPLGSASIGQTHRAVIGNGDDVVIKVIKPGIRDTILSDIRLLQILGHFLELIIPRYQPRMIINEFCLYTEKEVDLTYEADHAELFAVNFADYNDIVFPRIYRDLSTEDILTMEFLQGLKPDDPAIYAMSSEDQQKIISLGTGAILKMLYEDGFFHADLHAGNLFVLPGPKVGFIDLGMVGRFEEKIKFHMLYYFYSLVNNDIEAASKHLLAMATSGPGGDPDGFRRAVSDLFRRFRVQSSRGNFSLAQLILESLSIGGHNRIFFPVEMTLMVKALITFEGVGKSLDPNLDVPALSRQHMNRIFTSRYNPAKISEKFIKGIPELLDAIMNFPKLLGEGSRALEDFLNSPSGENPMAGLRSALMAGACVVGGVIALVQDANPFLWLVLFVAGLIFYIGGK